MDLIEKELDRYRRHGVARFLVSSLDFKYNSDGHKHCRISITDYAQISRVEYVWHNRVDSVTHKSPSAIIIASDNAIDIPDRAVLVRNQSAIDVLIREEIYIRLPKKEYAILSPLFAIVRNS